MKLISTHICLAKDLGVHNNLFGGVMLAWLDEAGAALAAQIINTPRVVTVMLDRVEFHRPVKKLTIFKSCSLVTSISIKLHSSGRKSHRFILTRDASSGEMPMQSPEGNTSSTCV